MAFKKILWRTELAGLAALFICACVIGLYGFIESYLWFLEGKKLMITPSDAAWLTFAYSGTIGIIAVLFYGAPAYALLRHKNMVFWWSVFLIGAAPGVAFIFFEREFGGWLIIGGVIVASITHILSRRFVSSEAAL